MLLTTILFSVFLLSLITPLLSKWLKGFTGPFLSLVTGVLFFVLLSRIPLLQHGHSIREQMDWIPRLEIQWSLSLDALSLAFALLITGIGALILLYGGRYLAESPNLSRFYGLTLFFMLAMLGLVFADQLIVLFVFWELTSISSFLLIGYNHESKAAGKAALQALLVTTIGGLALLVGFIFIGFMTGSMTLSQMLTASLSEHPLYVPAFILIMLGVMTKSAQVPFHFWLPQAMQAPTPVSAYLHSATMVKAGIYLLARLYPVMGGTELWHFWVTLIGGITMVTGALLALPQTDLKKLLAYSTISALGILVTLLGIGSTLATKAAIVFLIVHSLYKASLFMVAGIIDHETGTRDVTKLSGLARFLPGTALAAILAGLSMSGFPPLLGFISKELMYDAKFQIPELCNCILIMGVIANLVNVTIAGIVAVRPFVGKPSETVPHHKAPFQLWFGPLLLGALGLFLGLFPLRLGEMLVAPAVSAVQAETTHIHLKLWHGINPVLLLSLLTVSLGVVVYFLRHAIRRFSRFFQVFDKLTPSRLYFQTIDALFFVARWHTRMIQHGNLRHYLMTIILVSTTFVGFRLFQLDTLPTDFNFLESRFYELVLGVLMLTAAVAVLISDSRLAAVVSIGVVGYGVALFFILDSAPDLAMTQIVVETLTVILFALVIYRLPQFKQISRKRVRIRDFIVASAFGAVMTTLVLKASAIQFHPSISEFFVEKSYTEAFGKNIVNVILVDFRALDTLGEITVLSVAAMGIFALMSTRKKKKDN